MKRVDVSGTFSPGGELQRAIPWDGVWVVERSWTDRSSDCVYWTQVLRSLSA